MCNPVKLKSDMKNQHENLAKLKKQPRHSGDVETNQSEMLMEAIVWVALLSLCLLL